MLLKARVGVNTQQSLVKLLTRFLTLSKSFSCDTGQNKRYCEKLHHRGLIRVYGHDSFKLLQGLITNDITLLDRFPAIYSMMLNAQGRVLHDLIIYRTQDKSGVIVECDKERSSELISSLSRYKLRNKVNFVDENGELDVWSIFGGSNPPDVSLLDNKYQYSYAPDPRLASLGGRLVLPRGITAMSVVEGSEQPSADLYRRNLCEAGIGEGCCDFPPEHCFPLESNLAFLNGVSFDKGCYVGQELTARTHHTGVIRKRIMPMVLSKPGGDMKMAGAAVVDRNGKVCGKVRSVCGDRGLGLLRVADVLGGDGVLQVRVDGVPVSEARTFIPHWWPSDTDVVVQQSMSSKELDN